MNEEALAASVEGRTGPSSHDDAQNGERANRSAVFEPNFPAHQTFTAFLAEVARADEVLLSMSPMRLHLNLHRGDTVAIDKDGADFASVEDAKAAAVAGAREIMAERLRLGKEPFRAYFRIVDSRGVTVAVLPFHAAVPVEE